MRHYIGQLRDLFIFNLKHAMYVLDINNSELAERYGASRQHISSILSESEKGANLDTVEKMAKVLGLRPSDLLDENFQERFKKTIQLDGSKLNKVETKTIKKGK